MPYNILVPLDGSQLAECVLPAAANLASGDGNTHITFLYVIAPLDYPLVDITYKKKIEADAKGAADAYLKKLSAKPQFRTNTSNKVVFGKAADIIVDFALTNKMDLIIMATHGRSGIGQWFYGSVAEKVIHSSKVPIWLVKAAGCKMSYKNKELKVLVPLDGSKEAESVLPYLKVMTKQMPHTNLNFVLMRVCEIFSPPITYPPLVSMTWEEYLDYEKKRGKEVCRNYLKDVKNRLSKARITAKTLTPEGNPAEVLIKYANKNDVDLIMMTTHGRTGISKLAFGSIAEKVLKGSDCPILIIRAK